MKRYTLSNDAHDDLRNIYDYSLSTWGEKQANIYSAGLFDKFDSLSLTPHIGIARPELKDDMRSAVHQQHVIFYYVHENEVAIARILHGSRDISKEFVN